MNDAEIQQLETYRRQLAAIDTPHRGESIGDYSKRVVAERTRLSRGIHVGLDDYGDAVRELFKYQARGYD